MQIDTNGNKYDCRTSKDGQWEYSISFDATTKVWDVDCWDMRPGPTNGCNQWHRWFRDETKALAEYNRFE